MVQLFIDEEKQFYSFQDIKRQPIYEISKQDLPPPDTLNESKSNYYISVPHPTTLKSDQVFDWQKRLSEDKETYREFFVPNRKTRISISKLTTNNNNNNNNDGTDLNAEEVDTELEETYDYQGGSERRRAEAEENKYDMNLVQPFLQMNRPHVYKTESTISHLEGTLLQSLSTNRKFAKQLMGNVHSIGNYQLAHSRVKGLDFDKYMWKQFTITPNLLVITSSKSI